MDRVEQAERLIRRFPLLPFDEAAAEQYAWLAFKRGSFDRLIAAHGLALGLPVVTANTRDFHNIPGLKIENWTK
ncbi:PIN domain-containing protein [uncultured Sphingomonas sp.]|uniref:PIN domain-containing protein n=1 Tax=uncultured Sphingomonas sp. TaxID=158754 RepID=UPI0035C99003